MSRREDYAEMQKLIKYMDELKEESKRSEVTYCKNLGIVGVMSVGEQVEFVFDTEEYFKKAEEILLYRRLENKNLVILK